MEPSALAAAQGHTSGDAPHHGGEGRVDDTRVLVIDDNRDVLKAYRKILAGPHEAPSGNLLALEAVLFGPEQEEPVQRPAFQVDLVQRGDEGHRTASQARRDGRPYAVAFVDMRMPNGWDGLDTVEALWGEDPDIQVVICTAYADYSWGQIIKRLGNSDRLIILRKPFEVIEVLQLACALSEKWHLHRALTAHVDDLAYRVEDRNERLQQALSKCEDYESELHRLATHDALTGLPNRILLMDRLSHAISRAKRQDRRFVVSSIDLDRFKGINDGFGHEAGDEVLSVVSRRMLSGVRTSDTVARHGGDEFVLLLEDCDGTSDALAVLNRLMSTVSQPLLIGGAEAALTCSVGCSKFPDDGIDADTLLRRADAAMYRAKESGRNCIQFFNDELRAHIEERVRLETELRHAVSDGQLVLHYQPQIDLRNGRIVAAEALLRWQHPVLGQVSPTRFIPIAEETGLISPITEWVLRHACAQAKAWQEMGLPPVRMAVNVSAKLLDGRILPSLIARSLSDSRLEPHCLEIEVTETAAMENPDEVIPLMRELKELGVKLSIDDFGTGYSNMNYLRRFPVDALKLDGSFVGGITSDPGTLAIAEAIIGLGHRMGLSVVGEMAETEGQIVQLARHGCELVQGYYFSRPVPADEFARLLQSGVSPLPESITHRTPLPALLIVGDETGATKSVYRALCSEAYCIHRTKYIAEAFEFLACQPVGVVICDFALPESSGPEFLRRVGQLYPKIARFFLSDSPHPDRDTSARGRDGDHGRVIEPGETVQLREMVSQGFRNFEEAAARDGA